MSIDIVDKTVDLSLYHYKECDEFSEESIKNTRGNIFNKDNKLICSSYSFTPEYTVDDHDKYSSLELDKCFCFLSEEGTLLRLFFNDNKWNLSTHKKINAFESRWSSPYSFGDLFVESLQYFFTKGEGVSHLQVEEEKDVYDCFCSTLDTTLVYTFLLRTNKDTKIVCDPPAHPTLYFTGLFKDGTYQTGNPTCLPSPTVLTFPTVSDLETYVDALNPLASQGVMIMLPNLSTIKILNRTYVQYKKIRGVEPNIESAYLRVRKSEEETRLFKLLFPHIHTDNIENNLYSMVRYLHKMYIRRYIKKEYTFIQPAFFNILKNVHVWHKTDRTNHIVTSDKLVEVLNELASYHLYKLYLEYKGGTF